MSIGSGISVGQSLKSFQESHDKLWRHTVGRISCLARIPIYGAALLFQGVETGLKAIVSPLPSTIGYLSGTKSLERWSFSGVVKDGLMALKLLDKIGSSALGVIFAPPERYLSFSESIKSSFNFIGGVYHLSVLRNDKGEYLHNVIIEKKCEKTINKDGVINLPDGDKLKVVEDEKLIKGKIDKGINLRGLRRGGETVTLTSLRAGDVITNVKVNGAIEVVPSIRSIFIQVFGKRVNYLDIIFEKRIITSENTNWHCFQGGEWEKYVKAG